MFKDKKTRKPTKTRILNKSTRAERGAEPYKPSQYMLEPGFTPQHLIPESQLHRCLICHNLIANKFHLITNSPSSNNLAALQLLQWRTSKLRKINPKFALIFRDKNPHLIQSSTLLKSGSQAQPTSDNVAVPSRPGRPPQNGDSLRTCKIATLHTYTVHCRALKSVLSHNPVKVFKPQ